MNQTLNKIISHKGVQSVARCFAYGFIAQLALTFSNVSDGKVVDSELIISVITGAVVAGIRAVVLTYEAKFRPTETP